jgi:hypothetical protein
VSRVANLRQPGPSERRGAGQALVEFALILPLFALLLMGMLEVGLAFNHYMTLQYATREGSRTGSALADGGSSNCVGGVDAANVDAQTVAAVQRILKSPGSPIAMSSVTEIRLYRADGAGNQIGSQANVWRHAPGGGPDIDPGVAVDRLDFDVASTGWPVCSRVNGPNPDSIGVRVQYSYRFQTPLGAIADFFAGGPATLIAMDDRTVMALNPQN